MMIEAAEEVSNHLALRSKIAGRLNPKYGVFFRLRFSMKMSIAWRKNFRDRSQKGVFAKKRTLIINLLCKTDTLN